MGFVTLASAGVVIPAPSTSADLDVPPRRPGERPAPLLPGLYVLAEPAGDAPWAGVISTHWSHAAGAPAVGCPRCGIGRA